MTNAASRYPNCSLAKSSLLLSPRRSYEEEGCVRRATETPEIEPPEARIEAREWIGALLVLATLCGAAAITLGLVYWFVTRG